MSLEDEKRRILKDMIKDAMGADGPLDPNALNPRALPHRLRQRLEEQAGGDVDLDTLLEEVRRDITRGH